MALIDLRNQRHLLGVNGFDLISIIQTLARHNQRDFNVIGMLYTMLNYQLISREIFNNLQDRYALLLRNGFSEFFLEILKMLSFEKFCLLLKVEGYGNIVDEIRTTRFALIYKRPTKGEIKFSKRTHIYYKELKKRLDNDDFIDERGFRVDKKVQLLNIIKNLNSKIKSEGELSHDRRQFAAECKAAVTVLLISQYKNYEERKQILNGTISTETCGTDNISLQFVYHSKMAVTEAQEGHTVEAEEHLTQTKLLCASYGPCFAVTTGLHDVEYTSKAVYFNTPTEENLEKVLAAGDLAVQSVGEEGEDIRNLWQRILLLYMVLSLLFITTDFIVSDMKSVECKNKMFAAYILKEIQVRSDDIEYRRKMIVSLCQAAINEESNLDKAIIYSEQSLAAAEAGGCFREVEKKNIKDYLMKLQRRRFQKRMSRLCIWLSIGVVIIGVFINWFLYIVCSQK